MPRLKRIKQRRAREAEQMHSTMDDSHKAVSEPVIALGQWLKRNGYRNETRLEIYHSTTYGYGIFTSNKRFTPGDTVMTLPRKLLITGTMLRAYKPKVYGHFSDDILCLVVFLMNEIEDPESPWADYFEILPDKYHSLPCSWPPWDIKRALKTIPESFKDSFLKDATKMTDAYHQMRTIIVEHQRDLFWTKADLLDWDLFEWAYCTVNTRCVHLPAFTGNKYGDKVALVPYFDLLNHSADADVQLQFTANYELQLITRKPINRYSQVFIKYNDYSNRELLQHYGYTAVEEGPFLEVELTDHDPDAIYIKPSEQDIIPLSYQCLHQWLQEMEKSLNQARTPASFMKRLAVLRDIDFIKPTDNFELTWSSLAYFLSPFTSLVKLKNNLDVLKSPVVPPDEPLSLDWRLDLILQLMIRPKWDSTVNIRRLIYSDEGGHEILSPDNKLSWRQYYRLWIGLIDWILAKDYKGIKLDGTSSLEQYQATVVHFQVRAVLGNEVALLICLRHDLEMRMNELEPKTEVVEQMEKMCLNG